MIKIEIPDYKTLELEYLVLDYNGTIALDGRMRDEVKERLLKLAKDLQIHVLTADTHGTAKKMCEGMPLKIQTFPTDGALDEKLAVVDFRGHRRNILSGGDSRRNAWFSRRRWPRGEQWDIQPESRNS